VMAQIRDVMAELVAQQTKLLSNEVRVWIPVLPQNLWIRAALALLALKGTSHKSLYFWLYRIV
jgi:hypothetical protein